jgi:MFS family permease
MGFKSGAQLRLDDEEMRALTDTPVTAVPRARKWTFNLLLCCLTMGLVSIQFGLNISSLNSVTMIVKQFTRDELLLFKSFDVEQRASPAALDSANGDSEAADANQTDLIEAVVNTTSLFAKYQPLLRKIHLNVNEDGLADFIFTLINCLFVIGGMLGAIFSKYVLDGFGRKKGLLFHQVFTVAGAVLSILAFYFRSPGCILASRFFYGVQGGMSCSLVPTYLNEISPANLRGQTGLVHQIFINVGILTAQLVGFKEILGKESLWHFYLALPILPAILSFLVLLLFFPDSPHELFIKHGDVANSKRALQLFRNDLDVSDELQALYKESQKQSGSNEGVSLKSLLTASEYRWPLITAIVLQFSQQLCGVNAVIHYLK